MRVVRDTVLDRLLNFLREGSVLSPPLSEAGKLLHAEHSIFRLVTDYIPQMVWISQGVGHLDYCNRRWLDYTGLSLEESRGKSGWESIIHPDDRAACLARWHQAAQDGTEYVAEYRLRGAYGTYSWHLGRAHPLDDPAGDITWWIGSCTDIHEQKDLHRRDREAALSLQAAFLPENLPESAEFRLDAYYEVASDANVGGDWYSALRTQNGKLALVVGDVEGHGLDAAITMSRLRQSFITLLQTQSAPNEICALVNRLLTSECKIATALVALIEEESLLIRYALAGHPRPVLVNSCGEATLLACGGIPLGIDSLFTFDLCDQMLEPGSLLVLYSDGLVEFDHDIVNNERRLLYSHVVLGKYRLPRLRDIFATKC